LSTYLLFFPFFLFIFYFSSTPGESIYGTINELNIDIFSEFLSPLLSLQNLSKSLCLFAWRRGHRAPLLPVFALSSYPFRALEVLIPPWVGPMEARVSQPIGL
jgi:hypothetical protein